MAPFDVIDVASKFDMELRVERDKGLPAEPVSLASNHTISKIATCFQHGMAGFAAARSASTFPTASGARMARTTSLSDKS